MLCMAVFCVFIDCMHCHSEGVAPKNPVKVGFADSPIKVQTPAEFIESLG